MDQALRGLGWVVERMDFPYRREGRRAPDRPPVLLAAVRSAAEELIQRAGVPPKRLFLGGRSMGGRICSIAVAEGLSAAGLILVSYPLRPPGRPEKQAERTRHFPDLRVPCLFVSGTRDAFGTPDELAAAAAAITGPVTFAWIEGADHGLRRRDDQVAAHLVEWAASIL